MAQSDQDREPPGKRGNLTPVSGGVDAKGRIVISTYPARAKTRNAERHPQVTVLILSDDWNGPWVQVDGDAQVLHMPEAVDGLVEYFRSISGEHPDWDEYREAMRIQDKSLIRITQPAGVRSPPGASRLTWPRDSTADHPGFTPRLVTAKRPSTKVSNTGSADGAVWMDPRACGVTQT